MAPNIHRLLRAGLLIVVFVILLATAYLAGIGNMQKLRQDAYSAGYEAALAENGLAPVAVGPAEQAPQPVAVDGTVSDVSSDGFTIKTEGAEAAPERRVRVEDAEIVQYIAKDPATLTRELAAYQRNTNLPLPAPDEQRTIALSDLRPGDRVSVLTLEPDADPIIATRITRTATAPEPDAAPTPAATPPAGEPELMTP